MPGRQGSNPQKQNEEPLVPDTVLVTKRAGLSAAKNIRVGSVEALTLCGSVFSCGGCEWDVVEGVALGHPAADSLVNSLTNLVVYRYSSIWLGRWL